jgi:hypothetical protein
MTEDHVFVVPASYANEISILDYPIHETIHPIIDPR